MSHPDEGLIHAWLYGELDAAESARVEALAKADPAWAAAAAEARGLVAASSRILGKLDDVPANVVPGHSVADIAATAAQGSPKVTRLRESQNRRAPWWAMRVAALLVVATGTVFVLQRVSPDGGAKPAGGTIDHPVPAVPFRNDATAGANRPASTPARAPTIASAPQPTIRTRVAAEAESKSKDARAGGGGAVGGTTANVSAAAPAPSIDKTRRDIADAGKSAEEKLAPTISAAPSASTAGIGLRKEAPALSLQSVVTATATAPDCFREATAPTGATPATTPAVFRVHITSDSTAVSVGTGATQAFATAPSAGQAARQMARQMAARQTAASPTATLRLRGDTLFIGVVNGVTRIALRVSCPAP